jgi:hypothetical protein
MGEPLQIGAHYFYGLLLEEGWTGIASGMNNVLKIGVASKWCTDVMFQEVETRIVLILLEAFPCTLTITPQGINLALAMLHKQIRETASYQTCGTRDENISRQR